MVLPRRRARRSNLLGLLMNAFTRGLLTTLLSVALVCSIFLLTRQYKTYKNSCFSTSEPQHNEKFDSLQVNKAKHPRVTGFKCADVEKNLKKMEHPWQINELRRTVSLADPACFNKHYAAFAREFMKRIGLKQYHLQMPEAGGDLLCELAQQNRLQVPMSRGGNDCLHRNFCAYWRYGCLSVAPVPCSLLSRNSFTYIGNERWLDHGDFLFCEDRAYSISIREPVTRAMDQLDTWFGKYHKYIKADKKRADLLNLIQSNYMTWSLVSGASKDPVHYKISEQDLEFAQQMLSRFDFIIDLETSECFAEIAEFMGMTDIQNPLLQKEVEIDLESEDEFSELYDRRNYEIMNAIDSSLYEYAKELQRVDCDFFRRIKRDIEHKN